MVWQKIDMPDCKQAGQRTSILDNQTLSCHPTNLNRLCSAFSGSFRATITATGSGKTSRDTSVTCWSGFYFKNGGYGDNTWGSHGTLSQSGEDTAQSNQTIDANLSGGNWFYTGSAPSRRTRFAESRSSFSSSLIP